MTQTTNSSPSSSPDLLAEVRKRLNISRNELLDLGLRNPLLNYRPRKTYTIEAVGELPDEIYRILVREKRSMTFAPVPDKVHESRADNSQTDRKLQTNLTSDALRKKLLATHHAARTFIEEQGANILYVALGMLSWFEADSSQEIHKAPLLLVPVKLERFGGTEKFKLSYSEEDVQANYSLGAKLKSDFGIGLPVIGELEETRPSQYFESVQTVIRPRPSWSVDHHSVVLSFFSFGKFLMYRDLDEATWPADMQPSANSVLQGLFLNSLSDPPLNPSEDEHLDSHLTIQATHHVLEADSSQALALMAAKSGNNLVIQGPPGTGKSQTIANLIAEAVLDGKKVLFVAEKIAALDVVKRRLDSIGLGDFCLELHSQKSNKRAVVSELDRTLRLGKPVASSVFDDSLLDQQRRRLNSYSEAVNTPVGSSHFTPHQLMALSTTTRAANRDLALPRIALNGTNWSRSDFNRKLALIREVQSVLGGLPVPSLLPFHESRRTISYPADRETLRTLLQDTSSSLSLLEGSADEYSALMAQSIRDPTDTKTHINRWWTKFWLFLQSSKRTLRRRVTEQLASHMLAAEKLAEFLAIDSSALVPKSSRFADLPFHVQRTYLKNWREHIDALELTTRWNQLSRRLRDENLQAARDLAASWPDASTKLVKVFTESWYQELLDRAWRERPALEHFSRESHEMLISHFKELDGQLIKSNRIKIAQQHWQRLPKTEAGGQRGVIAREAEKKARHLPIRQLLLQAGTAVQSIKPVFLMSPLSVATFLDPKSVRLDLVVFDEASQIQPVDAFGAILRASQAIVVGDSKQLPPTMFFDSLVLDETDSEEGEESTTKDLESILGLFAAQMVNGQRMLRWHYRSKHESLIAVSNHEFYEDRLVIFPSASSSGRGLIFHHLAETIYDRGKSRTNKVEARIIAQRVIEHAREHPEMTLGVAAFSVAQMTALQDEVEEMRRQNPEVEPFFAAHPHEPFFVKNLENVQGDERDVIFISVGYGRDSGRFLGMSFGPLNRDGGERRLNVLISRARYRCEVFSNIRADDISLDKTNARGVRVLKAFLRYAETGQLDISLPTGRPPDSILEESIASALEARGLKVTPQVGCAGFFVDLGIVDPDTPGRFVLGVECDGAMYHSARSARDRDRLRQDVLEELGWTLHRVWSTDWFKNPDREVDRILEAVRRAQEERSNQNPDGAASEKASSPGDRKDANIPAIERAPHSNVSAPSRPYKVAHLDLAADGRSVKEIPRSALVDYVSEIVEVESPVHIDEVIRRVVQSAGGQRAGSRIEAHLRSAIDLGVQRRAYRKEGDFLFFGGQSQVAVRDRSKLDPSSRKVHLVSDAELRAAISQATANARGLKYDDVAPEACTLLGFARCTEEMREVVTRVLRDAIADGSLLRRGDDVHLSS